MSSGFAAVNGKRNQELKTMTKSVYRPTRMKNGKSVKSRMYRLCYQLPGMPKKKFVSLGTTDQQVASKKADEFLRELQQEQEGIIAPRTVREGTKQPLEKHLDDFVSDLRALGRAGMYAYNLERRLLRLFKECGWQTFRDITADSFQSWRAKQKKSAKTLKDYHDAATALLKWMERQQRSAGNPLAQVGRVQTKGKQVRMRRACTFDELNRLLAVSGPRRVGYLTAFFTGLRRAELRALEWGDVHLDLEARFIAVRAGTTKNHDKAEIHLHPQLARELARLRPVDAKANDSVFRRENIASMYMMRKDLEAAGIPFADAQGRRVDFHSLRGTLNTHLAGKVDPQVRQKIMRHSDIKLTLETYTDSKLLGLSKAIGTLPAFEEDATLCATNLDTPRHDAAPADTNNKSPNTTEHPEYQSIMHDLTQTDATCHLDEKSCLTRIRT
jgi:integrase